MSEKKNGERISESEEFTHSEYETASRDQGSQFSAFIFSLTRLIHIWCVCVLSITQF